MAACTTKILELRGFHQQLKTKDIQTAFATFGESFKIKWIDDNSLYLVFTDAVTAKRVFLQSLGSMPHQLVPAPNATISLTPYKGPDAQSIIAYTQRAPRSERTNSMSGQHQVQQQVQQQEAALALATGNVSPAVSMMLLAAAAAGPPGMLNGAINGTGYSPVSPQSSNNLPFLQHRGSNGSLRSSFSQGSIPESYSIGSNNSMPSISPSSSWSDAASNYSNYRLGGGRNSSMSLHPSGFPMSRSGLEDIAEASSREEMPSQTVSRANSIIPSPLEHSANIVVTASTPLVGERFESQQSAHPIDSRLSSPGKPKSDTERPGGPWLSREPSPTPSLPSLHEKESIKSLVDGVGNLSLQNQASNDEMALSDTERSPSNGINTPPEGRAPPRIGNPGKRMLGAALGIRHPSLPPRVIPGSMSVAN
ncbi:hypothetical protein PIIN_05205 [Serendipita indica DSM 11827]|uniref:Uncharacterized protein n=1 Tax=Serendipita indica (strain DSM 11827) TaxID=1109443 RepID=G4TIX7_SERID|nr:hypothetical protein PIIN_05205 [Serendipita indica DSM 11827]